MSTNPHSNPQVVVQTVMQPNNGLGTAGFVLSLVGLLSCGLLSPLGLILSFVAMFKQPRGLAVAGTIIGAVGSIWIFFGGLAIVMGLIGLGAAAGEVGTMMNTSINIVTAADAVASYTAEHDGVLPNDVEWKQLMQESGTSTIDGWGTPLQYKVLEDGKFEIRSAGIDKIFNTNDDITTSDVETSP